MLTTTVVLNAPAGSRAYLVAFGGRSTLRFFFLIFQLTKAVLQTIIDIFRNQI